MKKFKKSGFLKNKSFNIVSRFFLSSFIVISFFYVAPIIINFTDKNFQNKEFTNNSKSILNNTLNKDKFIEEDSTADADERDLLYDILEEKIRPAVAKDGGDIKFKEFKDGIVKVQLQGSCSGCPSSTMTLKQGVQNLLCHYLPEVKEVVAIQ